MENFPRLVFDEAHSEAWSLSPETARTINPVNPADASYALAAQELVRRGYDVHAHTGGPLTGDVLRPGDVLVIAHPADRGAERVTGSGSPRFSPEELDLIEAFVRGGGGLVVLGECDQDKYGNNLQELLGRFGIAIVSTTVQEGARRHQNVATWVLADIGATVGQGVLAGVAEVCFYRSGVLSLDGAPGAQVLAATSATADPAGQPLAAAVPAGLGRVVAFADSDLFGDDSIEELDHRTLWTNVVTWAAGATTGQDALAATAVSAAADAVELDEHWLELKDAVTRIRPLQSKDGSIDAATHDLAEARRLVDDITREIAALAPRFPHDADYLEAVAGRLPALGRRGLRRAGLPGLAAWPSSPTRTASTACSTWSSSRCTPRTATRPQRRGASCCRWSGREWLAELERDPLRQPDVPAGSPSMTSPPATTPTRPCSSPRRSPCARRRSFTWGAIFCDREAARFRSVVTAAAATPWACELPADAARLVHDQERWPRGLRDVGPHPRPHPHPRRPAVRPVHDQAADAVLDVRAGGAALRPHRLPGGRAAGGARACPHGRARAVRGRSSTGCSASRSPATGSATTTASAASCCSPTCTSTTSLRWTDNRLSIDWKRAAAGRDRAGRARSRTLYRDGIDRPKRRPLAGGVRAGLRATSPPTRLDAGPRAPTRCRWTGRPSALTDAVLPDEFPLTMFYEALRKKLADVIASTAGITAVTHGGSPRERPRYGCARPGWSSVAGCGAGAGGRRRWCARLAAAGATVVGRRRQRRAARAGRRAGATPLRADGGTVHAATSWTCSTAQATKDWADAGARPSSAGSTAWSTWSAAGAAASPSPRPDLPTGTLLQDLLIRTCSTPRSPSTTALRRSDDAAGRADRDGRRRAPTAGNAA